MHILTEAVLPCFDILVKHQNFGETFLKQKMTKHDF